MPPEAAKLLWDMREAAMRIVRFTQNKSYEDYLDDELLHAAVERQFEIIGEAMTRLIRRDPSLAQQITDYRKIAGFRSVLIHGYDSIDDAVTWGIIQEKLPLLLRELDGLVPPSPSA